MLDKYKHRGDKYKVLDYHGNVLYTDALKKYAAKRALEIMLATEQSVYVVDVKGNVVLEVTYK